MTNDVLYKLNNFDFSYRKNTYKSHKFDAPLFTRKRRVKSIAIYIKFLKVLLLLYLFDSHEIQSNISLKRLTSNSNRYDIIF